MDEAFEKNGMVAHEAASLSAVEINDASIFICTILVEEGRVVYMIKKNSLVSFKCCTLLIE
tara:strand:- start:328 stop:510 length:183 start_codon:yes stop_codon:yes gene_type:complete